MQNQEIGEFKYVGVQDRALKLYPNFRQAKQRLRNQYVMHAHRTKAQQTMNNQAGWSVYLTKWQMYVLCL